MTSVFVAAHPGLGDHIICNGLYRELARTHEKVWIATNANNLRSIRAMFSDLGNLEFINFGQNIVFGTALKAYLKRIQRTSEIETVELGVFGANYITNCRFDESFYRQAKIPFNRRWDNFDFPRDISRQTEVFSILVGEGRGEYAFIHDDAIRSMSINENLVSQRLRLIRPILQKQRINLTDYELVLRNASEIHCIESSFAAFAESLDLNAPKYAHRYARREARTNWRLEFTYKTEWRILL